MYSSSSSSSSSKYRGRNAKPSGFDSGFANVLCDSDSVSEFEACATYRIYTMLCDLCPSFADRPRSDY